MIGSKPSSINVIPNPHPSTSFRTLFVRNLSATQGDPSTPSRKSTGTPLRVTAQFLQTTASFIRNYTAKTLTGDVRVRGVSYEQIAGRNRDENKSILSRRQR
jgi:hypothetical protein